tara:strand:+ start:266 stop:559 length:294 start_codon:yes stop_codon:yes gene_type:complete
MKKLLSFILPIAIIFTLTGCKIDSETVYLRKDFRKIVKYHDGTKNKVDGIPPRYEVRIDGNWYHADENGNLTDLGRSQKQAAEMQSSDDGGGGGGGC